MAEDEKAAATTAEIENRGSDATPTYTEVRETERKDA